MLPFSITRLEAKYKTTNYNSVDLHKNRLLLLPKTFIISSILCDLLPVYTGTVLPP